MAKPKGKIIMTSIRVPHSLWERVRIEAIRRQTSAQDLVIEALQQFLKGGK
jgi:hypothetical protein